MCVCVFFPFILDNIKLVGRTSWGHTAGRSHRIFHSNLPSVVHALIFLARRIQPFLSLVDREVHFLCTNDLVVLHSLGICICIYICIFFVRKIPFTGIELTCVRPNVLEGYEATSELPGRPANTALSLLFYYSYKAVSYEEMFSRIIWVGGPKTFLGKKKHFITRKFFRKICSPKICSGKKARILGNFWLKIS